MIDFEHVSKEYKKGGRLALEDINFHVEEGEFVFLLGHSGAGKSTLLKLILREETPTEGRVLVNGQDVARLRRRKIPYLRRQMGIIFQDFRLIEKKTVYENLSFAMRAVGSSPREIKKRIPYVLELVGLEEKTDRYPNELSGGEQQRVAIARALVTEPSLLLADEPTGNLDSKTSREIMDILHELHEQGNTVVLITHDNDIARQAKRSIHILDGRVTEVQL